MRTLWHYLRLIRFPMTFAPVGAFIIGMVQSRNKLPTSPDAFLAMLALFFLSAGTLAFNGFYDREIDARKGESFAKYYPKKALATAITCYAICLVVSAAVSGYALLLFTLYTGATIAYSRYGVTIPALKNIFASFLSATLVIFGASIAGGINLANLITSLVFFFAVTAMELVKDLEDIEADREYRVTLAMLLPLQHIKLITGFCVAGAIIIGFLFPQRTSLFGILYVFASVAFIAALFRLPRQIASPVDHLPRRLIYSGLWIGLVAFVVPLLV